MIRQPKVKFNPDDYEVKQVFYNSKDGTKIPMFISYKKGIKLDGTNPTLMYGYGGFNVSVTPWFSIGKFVLMEAGSVFAVPNIRGGGEYGREWHRSATVHNRPRAYEDFIAAAEYLISEKYTQTSKTGHSGRPATAASLSAPSCANAPICSVPAARGGCDGHASLPQDAGLGPILDRRFRFLRIEGSGGVQVLHSYSPYHNLKPGTKYPATLVTTADSDDRVVPAPQF